MVQLQRGIISATDRQITIDDETMTLLQTDAAINPGNSGGGLFNADGNLIGIVNAKESSTGIEGLGFAIPITPAQDIITELMENGSVTSRPALNVSYMTILQKIKVNIQNTKMAATSYKLLKMEQLIKQD